jgi:hypothetical protein
MRYNMRMRTTARAIAGFVIAAAAVPAAAQSARPTLTGSWKLNVAKSMTAPLVIESRTDVIAHQEPNLRITTTQVDANGKNTVTRDYVTDGRKMTHTVLGRQRTSAAHWDGATLVIETDVSLPGVSYVLVDRWELSADARR